MPLKITENISKFIESLLFSFEMMDLKKSTSAAYQLSDRGLQC